MAGLDPTSCKNVTVTGSLNVSGTWTANSDGTYTDGTTTTGSEDLELPAGCLMLSGTTTTCDGISSPLAGLGFSDVTCKNAASGGGCSCTGTVQQSGLPGVVSFNGMATGNYTKSGNTLTIDAATPYSYCVSGSNMTWTPQTTSPSTTGTVVFQKSGGSGSGGATGSGGSVSSGGSTGSGGAKGGNTGSGGAAGSGSGGAKGGNTGSGGAAGSGSGGSTSTGGAAGSGTTGTGGSTSTGGSSGTRSAGPCDIYSGTSPATPCAAAYSTIRALSKGYTGFLYQVRNGSSAMNTGSGGTTKDIGITADGYADTATQDAFCTSTCTFSLLYDQSGNGNNLKVAPAGSSNGGTYAAMADFESSATKGSMTVNNGHKVYALYMNAREGYRLTAVGKGMPTGAKAQGIYELADGTHTGTACCWDFGDVSTDPLQYSTMNTIFFGTGFWGKGAGSGPWFMGDFEGGVWSDGASTPDTNSNDPSMKVQFAFGIVKTAPPSAMSIRVGNGNLPTATGLTTAFSGNNAAKTWNNSGGILLGIGSDNSNNSWGTFYEGAITNGEPSDATDAMVFSNVQSVGYGK